jgi:N-dimethylarginine dimethylaminohydrolase
MFLRPSPVELDAFRDQYDALVADLAAQGLEVELVGPEEYRSGLPEYDSRYSVSVYVGQAAATLQSVGVVVGTVREHLRGGGARRRARLGCVQLPNGQKHEFRLPES